MKQVKDSVKGEEKIEVIRQILISKIKEGGHDKVREFIKDHGGNHREINAKGYSLYKNILSGL